MKPFEFYSFKGRIQIIPINRGTLDIELANPFFRHYVIFKGEKNITCPGDDTYRPGQCPICDLLFEDLYLEEYNDAVLWI